MIPEHFDPGRVGEIYRVSYQELAAEARSFAARHDIRPARTDERRVGLLLVDVQNTFCIPGFELFVAGRSGDGAVRDNRRLAEFIYRNLQHITRIHVTLDTHTAMQIFHEVFLVDEKGDHPAPMTAISLEDVESGRYRVNPLVADSIARGDRESLQQHLVHYCRRLSRDGKYQMMVWPYHAMLGGIGHALVSAIEEAVFFHTVARSSQASFEVKGENPLTENYSVLRPEVLEGPEGIIARKNHALTDTLLGYDALIVAGQAKSHCVSFTISDLLEEIGERDPALAQKVYLLEDCTSPVVAPGVDFTEKADAMFREFERAGIHRVLASTPMSEWGAAMEKRG
ncbi:MAG TPA: isochorismatase [Vicinamibacteria bacterium]|nr:isochorismatase [Vicinamibacteria bacterium]